MRLPPTCPLKLLHQEAAGSAAEPRLEGPVPRAQQRWAPSRGPHLLLPGRASQRPLQHRAGALPAQTAQSGCALGWRGPTGVGEGLLSLGDLLSGISLSFSSHRLPRARCAQSLLSDT